MNSLIPTKHKSWHVTNMRWLALFFSSIIQSGNYYCYDLPAAIEDQILTQFNVTEFQYNLLYTLYSLPNIILPLIGGILIDYSGFKVAAIGFQLSLLIGQVLCVLGSLTNKYYYLLIGRFIYGLGGENMNVLQATMTSKWFKGREMAFAFGINLAVARVGSIIGSILSPMLYKINGNITIPLFAGLCFLIISALSTLSLFYLDSESDKRDLAEQLEEVVVERIQLKDCREFKLDLYLVVVGGMLSYSSFLVFQQNDLKMFKTLFALTPDQANIIYQIPFYAAAVLIPLIGLLIDIIGRRTFLLVLSSLFLLFTDVLYLVAPSCNQACYVYPITGQLLLSCFYTIYAAVLWPLVPLCVPQNTVGTAFGLTNTTQNFGFALFPLIVGLLTTSANVQSYRNMMMFFTVVGTLNLINHIILKLYDKYKLKGKLTKNSYNADKIRQYSITQVIDDSVEE